MQGNLVIFRETSELVSHQIKQFANRKSYLRYTNRARIDLIYIKQRIQHPGHSGQGLVESCYQLLRSLSFNDFRQHALKQMQGLKRLTKVMTGSGKKARFCRVGSFCLQLGLLQSALYAFPFSDIRKCDDDTFHAAVSGSIRQDATIVHIIAPPFDLSLDRNIGLQHRSCVQQQVSSVASE